MPEHPVLQGPFSINRLVQSLYNTNPLPGVPNHVWIGCGGLHLTADALSDSSLYSGVYMRFTNLFLFSPASLLVYSWLNPTRSPRTMVIYGPHVKVCFAVPSSFLWFRILRFYPRSNGQASQPLQSFENSRQRT